MTVAVTSQPLGDLRPGAMLTFSAPGRKPTSARLASLFKINNNASVFGLVGREKAVHEGFDLVAHPGSARPIGRLVKLSDVVTQGKELDQLFYAIRFDSSVDRTIQSETSMLAISRDVCRNMLQSGKMRVKSLKRSGQRQQQSNMVELNVKGIVAGEIAQPHFSKDGHRVALERGALVRGKGRKSFSEPGDAGLPVVSASKALLGFVLAKSNKYSLVMPAEDFLKHNEISLVSYGIPGSDPCVRLRKTDSRPKI